MVKSNKQLQHEVNKWEEAYAQLREDMATVQKENDVLKEKVNSLEVSIAQQKRQYRVIEAQANAKTATALRSLSKEQNRKEKAFLQKAVDEAVWPKYCLWPEHKQMIAKLLKKTYRALDPKPFVPGTEKHLGLKQWGECYGEMVASSFNKTRGYVCMQIKNSLIKHVDIYRDGKWPELDQIRACATREIKLIPNNPNDETEKAECEANMEVFVIYWDVILGHCSPANCKLWAPTDRYFKTISDYGKVTPAMETFAIWTCENCWDYWQKWNELSKQYKGHKLQQINKPPEGVAPGTSGHEVDGNLVRFYGPDWSVPYTNSMGGNDIFKGITEEGRERFLNLGEEVYAGRERPDNNQKEALVLAAVKKAKHVQGHSKQQRRASRKRKHQVIDNNGWLLFDSDNDDDGSVHEEVTRESHHLNLPQAPQNQVVLPLNPTQQEGV